MNKVQSFLSVSEVVLRNKQGKLQAGKRGWTKFKWPEFKELPYNRTSAFSDDKSIIDVLILLFWPCVAPINRVINCKHCDSEEQRGICYSEQPTTFLTKGPWGFPQNTASLSLFATFPHFALLPLPTANC
jgi:hypothetical protein